MPITMNDRRAAWAKIALHAFAEATGLTAEDGAETILGDLLNDLRHMAHLAGIDFAEIADRSEARFEEEIADPDPDIDELATIAPPATDILDAYLGRVEALQAEADAEFTRLASLARQGENIGGDRPLIVPDGTLVAMDRANYLGNMREALRTLQGNRAALAARAGGDVGPLDLVIADLRRRAAAAAALAEVLGDKDDADEESDAAWRRQQGKRDAYQQMIALLTGATTPATA